MTGTPTGPWARPLRVAIIATAALASALGGCATTHRPTPATIARGKLARELVARGDWERAFVMLDDLHRQDPSDTDVLTLRGIVYRERGLFADAETDLKDALAAAPDSAEAHAALGILYDVQLRSEAEAQHRAAVRLAPNNPAYLNNLGFSLYLRQHFKEAIAEYEKAARLVPLSRRVRTNLGFACAASGDWRRAAREFAMGGSEAEAKNNLGFAYERRGDLGNAYDLYLEALRIDPAAPAAGKARSNLVHAAAVLGRPVPAEALAPPPSPPGAPGSTVTPAPTAETPGAAPTAETPGAAPTAETPGAAPTADALDAPPRTAAVTPPLSNDTPPKTPKREAKP